ncbi:MAG: hypothetical protein AAGG68_18300 [Bacteroidota bacterium]
MDNHFYKSTGIALISGTLLIIATMVLHPSGGSLEHIIHISKIIMTAHSLAIFSLPITLFGFYGLTIMLLDKWRLSILAFIIIAFGLIAAMFAALFNGLVLPYFLNQYADRLDENMEVLKPISTFSFAINHPLDYIFIIACCLSIFVYSIIGLIEGKRYKWIGYLGVLIVVFAAIGGVTGFVFTSLTGFRMFTFSIAGWILLSGGQLITYKYQAN